MRHGEAISQSEWSGGDFERPQSKAGRKELEAAISFMSRAKLSFHELLASPYVRTAQTAKILGSVMHGMEPQLIQQLASGASLKSYREVLGSIKVDTALIIGHMPELAIAVSRFSGLPDIIESGIKPAEIVAVDFTNSPNFDGKLMWRRTLDEWKELNG